MKSYDALVIGAGIAGLSVARELAKLKKRVLVLEREAKGGNASRAAAGTLDPYTEAEEETPLFRVGLKALDFYPTFLKEIGRSSSQDIEYGKLGVLYLAMNSEDEGFLKNRLEWQKKEGLPVKFLSNREVHQSEPSISKRVQSGVLFSEIPKLNPARLTAALFEATESAGVEIQTLVKQMALRIEKGRVQGVDVAGNFIESPAVVLATGSWTGLDPKLGAEVKMSPVRGQILLLRSKPSLYPQHVLHTIRYAYIIPWPENRLLVGSTLESVGFDDRVTEEGKKDILNRASEILEGLEKLPVESSWAGLRPCAERGKPFVGPTKTPGLFLAAGYYRSGILIGPLIGKLLAEGIHSGKFSPLIEPFFPESD